MRKITILTIIVLASIWAVAQKVTLNGYIKEMAVYYKLQEPIALGPGLTFDASNYNLVHNRLNFKYYPTENLNMTLEVRNRLFSGKLIGQIPGYAKLTAVDDGLVDLSWNLFEQDKYFFNTTIDRLYIDYTYHNWKMRVGRQRINWGINLVWNPNDIFNAFSYIDFDYEERPGSDAALVTWYPTSASALELAWKPSRYSNSHTLAAKYRMNLNTYDVQFIGGISDPDFVVGTGWTGNLWELAFRGEASWFIPKPGEAENSKEAVAATVSLDYTFSNSLYLHGSFLYNSMGATQKGSGISILDPTFNLSAKRLSIGRYELFGQAAYPFSPIVNGSFAAMINPLDWSMYLGPSLVVSLHDDFELMLTAQLMLGETGSEYGAMGNTYACFGRLRWSF